MNCASKIVDACGGPDDAIPHVQAMLDELVAAERERCAALCDATSEFYQKHEGRKYPELKTTLPVYF